MAVLSLASFLQKRMCELGFSNTEVANRAGISRQTWYRLLNAEIEEAKLTTLIHVAGALEIHLSHLLQIYFENNQGSQQLRKFTNKKSKFGCGFIADVTYPVNSLVHVGQRFEKVWRVANIGKLNWEGLSLVCMDDNSNPKVSDYLLQGESHKVPIKFTKTVDTVDLRVKFVAPRRAGTVLSEWRACDVDGSVLDEESFPPLFCIVRVVSY